MTAEPHNSVEVFYSYAHEDEKLRDELKKHLSNLKRQGVITDWYDRDISAGTEWNDEIEQHLESARVILLLISPDFMNSDYINYVEVKRAMERHASKEARVIPVILRPVDWEGTLFSKLQGVPTDAKPVTSWDDRDEAFLDITRGIRKAIQELSGPSASVPTVPDIPRPPKVGFVSRRDKDGRDIVERLRVELSPEKHQLVALWGAGGVGKTTLAAETVRAIAETYGQRIIWISADGRPNFVFSTLLDDAADQLGRSDLRPLAVGPKEEALRPVIGSKPTLIVLDNLETIAVEEESLCKEFLAKRVLCPALITTRERIDDALLIPLPAMSSGEASEFLNRLIAQSPDPDIYEVVQSERILQTAEYNPLIIQWIVAQIDLAQDPEEVLTDLARGEGDAARRVFDRSYNLPQLDNGGRAVLLALALFTPSAGRPTLAGVAGMDLGKKGDRTRFKKAQEVLASLWLIKTTEGGLRLSVAGLTRELTKAHLHNDLRAETFRQRFVSHFMRYAEAYAKPTRHDYDSLELEKDNLMSAMDVASDRHDSSSVMRLMDALNIDGVDGFLPIRGYWDEGIRRGEQALEAARSLSNELRVAQFSHNLAIAHQARGNIGDARNLYNESFEISKRLGVQAYVANSLHELGRLASNEGDLDDAYRLFKESMEIEEKLGNRSGLARTFHNLANIAKTRGELEEARGLYLESLAINRELNDHISMATNLRGIGQLAHDQGQLDEARRLYTEALTIVNRLGDQSGIAGSLNILGTLAQDQSNFEEARQLYSDGLVITKKLGNLRGIACCLHQLGTLNFSEANYEDAEGPLQESLVLLRKLGDKVNCAECIESIGKLRMAQGKFPSAEALFAEALKIAEVLKAPFRIASVKRSLGLLAALKGQEKLASQLLYEAMHTFERLRSPKAEDARRDLKRLKGKQS